MSFLLIFVSAVCLAVGLVFIYKPAWIVRFNKIVRDRIFNDTLILLDRRKKGFFLILMFFIFFYLGYNRIQFEPAAVSTKIFSTQRLLYESFQNLNLRHFAQSRNLCAIVVEREPNNAEAYYQLGAVQFLMDDPVSARKSWAKAKSIDPGSYQADRLKKLVVRLKNLPSEEIPALK